ncbi:helix-turn-helix domain-containing protein [Chryseobacterium sp. A321]
MELAKFHHGRNVKRFREMLGIKQESLAFDLGEEWNQQKISILEQKAEIDKSLLEAIARALKIPVEAIENFDEKKAVSVLTSTLHEDPWNGINLDKHNPVDILFEALDEIKKLYTEVIESKNAQIKVLERLLNK